MFVFSKIDSGKMEVDHFEVSGTTYDPEGVM